MAKDADKLPDSYRGTELYFRICDHFHHGLAPHDAQNQEATAVS